VNYARRVTEFFLIYMKNLRENRTINSIKTTALWNSNGIAKQVYFDGPWQLEEHEALIIETAIPERCRYWNLQLADPLSCGIDPLNRQTSLNGFQAELDSDGKFRAIIAGSDPGVPNWLDTGNYGYGSMLGRWLDADSSPQPSVRKVALNEVRDYLPKDTPTVSAEERDNRLRARRKAAQLRRRW